MSKKITYAILKTIGVTGLIGVALVAPNALQLLSKVEKALKRDRRRDHLSVATRNLEKKGLLKIDRSGFVRLTNKGKEELEKLSMEESFAVKPRVWDKKYRIIIFDIPERKRRIRIKIMLQLNAWGFVRLQNSVWVYPYECQEVVTLLKSRFGVGGDVLYITADNIENDVWLKRQFGLV